MRNLAELIVLVRGGGEVGSAIAHRLFRSHFRVCITEIASPLAVSRGTCFSEAIYDITKTIEDVTAERTLPSLENIYRVWRNQRIPIVVDPELSVRALLKPDVMVHAMMLKRKTSATITDAPLVIGIGSGFIAGEDVHLVVESALSNDLGKLIFEGSSFEGDSETTNYCQGQVIYSSDAGVFTTSRNIGEKVNAEEIIGKLGDLPVKAPIAGVLRGILRNEVKVLANTRLAEIDPAIKPEDCFSIRGTMRAISGGVLEAIMLSYNFMD